MKKLKIKKDRSLINNAKTLSRFAADEDINPYTADEFKATSLEKEIKKSVTDNTSESLHDLGLSGGGYEDYLKSKRSEEKQNSSS